MADYLLGLATIPAVAAGAAVLVFARWFIVYRIQRTRKANTRRRAALAARLFSSRRGWMWSSRHLAVAVTLGHDPVDGDQAEAVLLDEFVPLAVEEVA